jgi:hypothetical protein
MVGTRAKNKGAHPAAPVMTDAAKIRAGIPTKRQSKKLSKGDQIRELQARLDAFERPNDTATVSKEPLVSENTFLLCSSLTSAITQFSRDSSPEDVDRLVIPSEAPTEPDDGEDFIFVGGKRIPLSDYNPRCAHTNPPSLHSNCFIHPGP